MKIDFDQKLKNLNGEVIKETAEEDSEDVTLKTVCIVALTSNIIGEQVEGEEKYKRWKLSEKLEKGGTIDLETTDIVKLKDLIGKVHGVVIMGQSWDMLEKKSEK